MHKHSKSNRAIAILCFALATTAANGEEIRIDFDGKTLNADSVMAEDKVISDGVIIIVHGTLGHKDMEIIDTLQSVLQESGHSSLAINLSLGIDDRHGFYPCDIRHTHRSDDAVKELRAWRAWLTAHGASNVAMLGHSRGANQVVKYALANASTVWKIILLAPPATDVAIDRTEHDKRVMKNAAAVLPGIQFLHCKEADVEVATYLSYMGSDARHNTLTLLNGIQVPTLVISGSDDTVVANLSDKMAAVDNRLVRHVEIDGAGHFFRDLYGYDVVDAIDSFLAEPPPRLIKLAASLRADVQAFSTTEKFHVVFISQNGCEYCELLRKTVLFPMIRSGGLDRRIELREVSLDDGFELQDFQGQAVKGLNFAERYGAYVTPTLLFLGANGANLAEPLVGTGNIEFYNFYLEKKIEEAARSASYSSLQPRSDAS